MNVGAYEDLSRIVLSAGVSRLQDINTSLFIASKRRSKSSENLKGTVNYKTEINGDSSATPSRPPPPSTSVTTLKEPISYTKIGKGLNAHWRNFTKTQVYAQSKRFVS